MLDYDGKTIGQTFDLAAKTYGDAEFLCMAKDADRAYWPEGYSLTYAKAGRAVMAFRQSLAQAGYGHGHRIACLLSNRPEMMLLKLAMNGLGISWVPINPDYRPAEMAYVLGDSMSDLVIAGPEHRDLAQAAIAEDGRRAPLMLFDRGGMSPPPAGRLPPTAGKSTPAGEASLLYTSGTTGRPKGCILSHEYELEVGAWYARLGGRMALREGRDRVYNPLPLFHLNAAVVQFFGMVMTGNCQIATHRFSASKWWPEIRETRANAVHYLGVVAPVLMNAPEGPGDRDHQVRWGAGAGIEPSLHGPFEDRFGFPLVELWGMTEMCRVLADAHEPRQIHTRAFGRPQPGLEVRVVDDQDNDVPVGESGEMLVRHSADTPRKHAFSGYLNLPEATEDAWRGGWFHTGDTVSQDASGMLYFVDRKKNIIRRSGENIAAAEVEACIQAHANVAQVAVIAIEDELRDEEVMACIVARDAAPDAALARAIFDLAFAELAYFKPPGWIVFVDELPVTGTQKILKHMIFTEGVDPKSLPATHDFRRLKRR